MAAPASDWLRHFRLLLWNHWMEFQWNLTESKITTSSTKFVCFDLIEKTRWPPWPLIGWDIFDFSENRWKEFNKNLTGSEILTCSTKFVFFRADWKNKMTAPVSDLLRHFRLNLWKCWIEFSKTGQEARSQSPLPSLCFLGRSEKQGCRPDQSVKNVAHCTQVPFGPLVSY